jgi:hypothetical protein
MKLNATFAIGCLLIFCLVGPAQAGMPDTTQAVSLRWDYHNFCGEYGIGSPLLTYCFGNNGAQIVQGMRERLDCRR